MEKQKFSLSLSRAHKIVERLNAEVKDSEEKIQNALQFQVSLPLQGSLDEFLLKAETTVKTERQRVESLLAMVCEIRQKVGQTNIKAGVADKLATMETKNRQMASIKNLLRFVQQTGDKETSVEQAKTANAQLETMQNKETSAVMLQALMRGKVVTSISKEYVEEMQKEAEKLKKDIRKISDEINDANQKTISVEMNADLAETLGL